MFIIRRTGLIRRDPVVPCQKLRLDPPGTYITVSNTSPSQKLRLDPTFWHLQNGVEHITVPEVRYDWIPRELHMIPKRIVQLSSCVLHDDAQHDGAQ